MAVNLLFCIALTGWTLTAQASVVGGLTTFTAGGQIKAAEVNGNFTALTTAVDDNAATIATLGTTSSTHTTQISTLNTSAGSLATRMTSAESSISSHADKIGNLTGLTTTDKTNLVSAMNEVRSGTLTIPAGNISGQVSSSNLSTALADYQTIAAAAATYGALSADNTWTGANSFAGANSFSGGSLKLPSAVVAACAPATEGQVRYVSGSKVLEYCDGNHWRTPGVRRYTATATVLNGGGIRLNFGEPVDTPTITIWKDIGGGALQRVTSDTDFLVTFTVSQAHVTNLSGGTLTLTMIALVP